MERDITHAVGLLGKSASPGALSQGGAGGAGFGFRHG